MECVLITHEVEDNTAWKKILDDTSTIRKNAGEQSCQVLTYEKESNKLFIN